MKVEYNEALLLLQNKLREYLETEGVTVNANRSFKCVNKAMHKNSDSKPSGWLYENGDFPNWRCMACGEHGDIFNIASLIHGLPLQGKGFIHETIPFVAERLGMELEIKQDEEIPSNIKLSMEAKKLIKNNKIDFKLLTDGTFGSTRKYRADLAKAMVEDFDLALLPEPVDNNPILHPTTHPGQMPMLIPVTKDGMVLGTIGRYTESAVQQGVPKYKNSIKNEEFPYPSILNYDRGLATSKRSRRLYVFEGVFNTIAAYSSGINNSIGILGVNFRVKDLEELVVESGIREIVFCLDKDLQGADKAIELGKKFQSLGYITLFYKYKDKTKDYDLEFNDDENFSEELRNENNLISLIDYILFTKADYLSKTDISNMSKFELIMNDISMFGSVVNAKNYAYSISDYYKSIGDDSVLPEDILPRIKQSLLDKSSPLISRLDDLAGKAATGIINSKTVEEKLSHIENLYSSSKRATENVTTGIKISGKKDLERLLTEQDTIGMRKYSTGYMNLDMPIDENHKIEFTQENLVGLLGKPSHGKSLFLRGFAMHQALTNPDVLVFYFSTDDSARRTIAWMIAGLSRIKFSEIMKPEKERDRVAQEHIREAQVRLKKIYGESLIVYDKEQASDTNDVIRILNDAYREYPGKRFIVIVDNLYNQSDVQSGSETSKRESLDNAIERYKYLTTSRVDVFINSLEVKKNIEGRLSEKDIKETGSIDYRNDMTMAMFNSFREYKQNSKMFTHIGNDFTPIIEISMLKKKTGEVGFTHYFHLDGPCGVLIPVTDPERISQYSALMNTDRGFDRSQRRGSADDSEGFGGGGSF